MKRIISLMVAIFTIQLDAAPTITTVRATPMTAVIGTPTQITVQASITDPSFIKGGADLLELNPDGTTTVLGTLHDDGLNGDLFAGDLFFTVVVTLNASSASQIKLQVSAAFAGELLRVRSPVMNVFFQPANAPQQALTAMARNLAAGNRALALSFVNPSSNSYTVINTYSQQALNFLASLLNAAVLIDSSDDSRVFQSLFKLANGDMADAEFDMVPGASGQWVINSW
jgi:hypothetical protein